MINGQGVLLHLSLIPVPIYVTSLLVILSMCASILDQLTGSKWGRLSQLLIGGMVEFLCATWLTDWLTLSARTLLGYQKWVTRNKWFLCNGLSVLSLFGLTLHGTFLAGAVCLLSMALAGYQVLHNIKFYNMLFKCFNVCMIMMQYCTQTKFSIWVSQEECITYSMES